jgi:hypothetical protein
MAQRQKRPQKTFSKYEKSKVNYVILLYKNNAKINKPLLVRSFFFSIQENKCYFTVQIKRKGRKEPLIEDPFF